MANEDKKDFNAMLHRTTDMPRIQLVTDAATVQKYGGARMYFAPAADYDAVMKRVPFGKVLTVGKIREYFARKNGADFTDPKVMGNAGSFFMNPIVAKEKLEALQRDYPRIPYYELPDGRVKIPAGWMIDQCGWKGKSLGPAAVHDKQALVLVNQIGRAHV